MNFCIGSSISKFEGSERTASRASQVLSGLVLSSLIVQPFEVVRAILSSSVSFYSWLLTFDEVREGNLSLGAPLVA